MALARTLASRCWYGWSADFARDHSTAFAAAERAVALDERDPYSHYVLALANTLSGRHQQALAETQRAIDLSPNFALAYFVLGEIRVFTGHFAEAPDPLMRCLRLNPNDPQRFRLVASLMALAQYHLGNYEEAVQHAERALRGHRSYPVLRTLAACLGQLGRTVEAGAVLAEMERIKPVDAERHWEITNPYADPAHRAQLLEGLRRAGMPT
jgi:adenylate cyclase